MSTLILRQALGVTKARAQDRLQPLPSRERSSVQSDVKEYNYQNPWIEALAQNLENRGVMA